MTTSQEARIEISTYCNYDCEFCPYGDDFYRKKEIMSNEMFDDILEKISKFSQINTITLSGLGEIFFDKNILYKISKIKSKGYRLNILTNGSLLDMKMIDNILLSGVDSIRISVHTTNPNQYKKITKSNHHSHVLDMIQYIQNHPLKKNIDLIISADIIDINENNINNLIMKFSSVDLLEIWKPHNWILYKNYRQGKKSKITCGRPFKGPIQVQVDGTINMCCFDYNGKLLIGDLKTQSLEEIYSSKEYLHIKNCHESGDMDDLLCKHCDQLYDSDTSIVIYNSKFDAKDRITKTSSNYEDMK